MERLEWLKLQLKKKEEGENHIDIKNKKEINKRMFRLNMLQGTENIDEDGVNLSEWDGAMMYALIGRKLTDAEYIDYCDWLDNDAVKDVSESIYDNLKVFFDSRGIEMLPKIIKKKEGRR